MQTTDKPTKAETEFHWWR